MCFLEKMNCIRISKKKDRVPNPVRTLGRVESGTGARSPHTLHVQVKRKKVEEKKKEKERREREKRRREGFKKIKVRKLP